MARFAFILRLVSPLVTGWGWYRRLGRTLSIKSTLTCLLVPFANQTAQSQGYCQLLDELFEARGESYRSVSLTCDVSASTSDWGGRFSTPRRGEISVEVCERRLEKSSKLSLDSIYVDGAVEFSYPASLRMNQPRREDWKRSANVDPNIWVGDDDWTEPNGRFSWLSVRINRVTGSFSYTEVFNSPSQRFARSEFDYAEKETRVEGTCVKMDPNKRKF
jgi:hypothetical protein